MKDKHIKLISYLSANQNYYFSSNQLSVFMDVSTRTINRYINEINDYSFKYGFKIESQYGKGYKIIIEDEVKFSDYYTEKYEFTNFHIYLFIIAMKSKRICFIELESKFYYSKASVLREIELLNQTLSMFYNVKLTLESTYLKFEGSELMVRNLLSEALPDIDQLKEYLPYYDLEIISYINYFLSNEYNLNNENLGALDCYTQSKYLYISITRFCTDNMIDTQILKIIGLKSEVIYKDIIDQISDDIKMKFNIIVPEEEKRYWLIILLSRDIKFTDFNNNMIKNINHYVNNALEIIYMKYGYDFSKDLILVDSLIYHVVRSLSDYILNQKILPQESNINEIYKEKYRLAFFFSIEFCNYLEDSFGILISEMEVEYIGLHFATSLERNYDKKIYTIAWINHESKASEELIKLKLNKNLERAKIIETARSFEEIDVDNYDFILVNNVSKRYGALKKSFNKEKLIKLDKINFKNIDKEIKIRKSLEVFKNYYIDSAYINNIKASNRFDAIEKIGEILKYMRLITKCDLEKFIERENTGSTVISRSIAMPHAIVSGKSFISIGKFPEPIVWGNNLVSMVIFVGLGEAMQSNKIMIEAIIEICNDKTFSKNMLDTNNARDLDDLIERKLRGNL